MDTETEVLFHIQTVCDSSYFSSSDTLFHSLGMDKVQGFLHYVDLVVYVMKQVAENYLLLAEGRLCHLMILHSYQMYDDRSSNLER